mmetsp:Transcript_31881/g.48899  ORF Transcript_31881/g.48899 Transcript_31881/m.48899 type:complete len:809 (+) Transcript_31881:105-2531(+)
MNPTIPELPEEDDLQTRIKALQKAVWKATEEAIKSSQNEEPRHFKSTNTSTTDSYPGTENDDPNISFALGMTLFGQETTVVEREVQKKLKQIENELQQVVLAQQTQEPSGEDEDDADNALEEDGAALEAQAAKLTHQIAFLKECSKARSLLDEATFHQEWIQSAALLAKAQTSLASAEDMVMLAEHANAPHLDKAHIILESLRVPIRRKRGDLVTKAENMVRSCITVSPQSLKVRSPEDAYKVLESLEDGMEIVHRLADDLNREVFQPLLESHRNGTSSGPWAFRENTVNEAIGVRQTKGPMYTLEWSSRTVDIDRIDESDCIEETNIMAWGQTLTLIRKIMAFVQERVLVKRSPLCGMIGKRLFGKSSKPNAINLEAFGLRSDLISDDTGVVMKPMISLMWDTCIPSARWEPSQVANLSGMEEQLKKVVESFEQEMTERNFLASQSPLPDFCTDFEQKHADRRRAEILGVARDLLLNNDYHNTKTVGKEIEEGPDDDVLGEDGMSIFEFHQCAISITASRLHELCRNTMDEAVESSAVLARMLYRTAREILDLFRAMIPATHVSEVAQIPRTAAVLHNDCVFFAHKCLTLGLEYKEKFTKSDQGELRRMCMFVDMVPPFRELANKSLGEIIEKQQFILWELVGSRIKLLGDAMRENEDVAEWTDAETALTAGRNHLRHLSQAWKTILSKEIYTRCMGHLVDTLFNFYLDKIMEAKDISEPASHFVSVLFQNATRSMSDLVERSPLWDRFTAVGRFMGMNLADIQNSLSEGVFRSVTAQELTRLITATFDRSERRERLLKVLSTQQQR